jgi:hypothetical protein
MVILDFGFWILDFGIGDCGVGSMRKNHLPLLPLLPLFSVPCSLILFRFYI